MGEQWKQVEGFENYMVSSYGNVKSIQRTVTTILGSYETKEKNIKPTTNGKSHLKVHLYKDGKYHERYVHRLVAEQFLPNINNLPEVNHIDCNPNNNRVENLEWCTHKANMEWMVKMGRNIRTPEWIEHLHSAQEKTYVAVVGTNIESGEKICLPKLNDVREAGFQPSCVCDCCKGKRKTHKGFVWQYEKTV